MDHKGTKEEWDEWNEDHGQRNVFDPICARHCTVCDGEDHHWLDDCDPDGEPVKVCKHCDTVRDWDSSDDDEIVPVFTGSDKNIGPAHWGKTTQGDD